LKNIVLATIIFIGISYINTIKSQDISNETIADSVIYVFDTIFEEETMPVYVYGQPKTYLTVDINGGLQLSPLFATHSNLFKNEFYSISSSYHHNSFIFSAGISKEFLIKEKTETAENISLTTKEIVTTDPSIFHYENGEIVYPLIHKYVSDTLYSSIKSSYLYQNPVLSIPITFGYKFRFEYSEITASAAISITHPIINRNMSDVHFHIRPSVTYSYLLFYFLYINTSASFSYYPAYINNLKTYKIKEINNITFSLGISFIIYDKKRE